MARPQIETNARIDNREIGTFSKDHIEAIMHKATNRTCLHCNHFPMCNLMKHLPQMWTEYTEETQPFDYLTIAKLCKHYLDNSLVLTLRENFSGETTQ